jgi:hypothetical protein
MKKTVYVFGAAILIMGLGVLYWFLNRPLPIPLDNPKAQSIKDVLVKSYKIEALLCNLEADVNLLDEVYKDTSDYKQTKYSRVVIAEYLAEEAVDGAGYLTYKKAYYLWRRSGDPYPSASPDLTSKPVLHCPDIHAEPELRYVSIAIREDKAIVVYEKGAHRLEALLRKMNEVWFIVSLRSIAIIA